MKSTTKILSIALIVFVMPLLKAQTAVKQKVAILSIDAKGIITDGITIGNMVRTELEKLDTFNVIDRYDIQLFLEENRVNLSNCFGKNCLTAVGAQLKADKMFTGSIEQVGKNMVITYRFLDVATGELDKSYVHEFLYIQEELQNMIKLSVADMFAHHYDRNLMEKLSKPFAFDNVVNNPEADRLVLDGPRMGFVTFTGKLFDIVQAPKSKGGFNLFPVMFQFGYQFEKQYLNEGNIQALFECIPMVTGLDQGYFLPSITLMHGVRSNVNGWEIAFGPNFNIIRMGKGYYDASSTWHMEGDWHDKGANAGVTNPFEITERLDSRGNFKLKSYFILAAGRTFKSGRLNIPLNAYVIPGMDGWRVGISFGFNAKNKKPVL